MMNSPVANFADTTEPVLGHQPDAAPVLPTDSGAIQDSRSDAVERDPAIPTVIVVGPPATQMGGMASVAQQILAIDFGRRYHTRAAPCTFGPETGETFRARVRRHISQVGRLGEAIRRWRAPIVHLHTCSGFSFFRSAVDMLAAQRLGARVLLHIHGAAFDRFFAEAGFLKRRLISASLSRADGVIALSKQWRRKLQDMAPCGRICVVENAVAIPPLRQPRQREQMDSVCHFLLLARMDAWKGIDDLLTACARLRDRGVAFALTLAGPPGTAGNAEQMERKIADRNLGSAVTYVGPALGREKLRLFESANVYVQPSHHEGMPISLLEALAHGLPVIATTVGAIPEIITQDQEGMLVPPHRPDLLAAAMSDLAGNPDRRARMSVATRCTAERRFSLDRLRDDLVRLYDAVCRDPVASPIEARTALHAL